MEKDITTNNLIENNDIFADIVNVNLFEGEQVIRQEDLESVPVDTSYKDLDGRQHRLFRDSLKKVKNFGGCIAFLGCENQTEINNVMPVRNMGYNYTVYSGQIREMAAKNNRDKHSAYAKVLHDDQKLMPVATFVLYYGRKKWERPLTLMDVLDISDTDKEFWEKLISDYKIRIIHMADQPEEIRGRYQSDYGVIADYLAYHGNKKELDMYLRKDRRKLVHVEQVLDMLHALSGDKRFELIKGRYLENDDKEERDYMCVLLDMCEEEGVKKGISLVKRVVQLDIGGKKAEEIAEELGEEVFVIKDIVESMSVYKRG